MSVISYGEIKKGIEKLDADYDKKISYEKWLYADVRLWFQDRLLDIDCGVMNNWARLVVRVSRTLPVMDSLIAATAIAHGLTLVTRNIKDFVEISELNLLNPWE